MQRSRTTPQNGTLSCLLLSRNLTNDVLRGDAFCLTKFPLLISFYLRATPGFLAEKDGHVSACIRKPFINRHSSASPKTVGRSSLTRLFQRWRKTHSLIRSLITARWPGPGLIAAIKTQGSAKDCLITF